MTKRKKKAPGTDSTGPRVTGTLRRAGKKVGSAISKTGGFVGHKTKEIVKTVTKAAKKSSKK